MVNDVATNYLVTVKLCSLFQDRILWYAVIIKLSNFFQPSAMLLRNILFYLFDLKTTRGYDTEYE